MTPLDTAIARNSAEINAIDTETPRGARRKRELLNTNWRLRRRRIFVAGLTDTNVPRGTGETEL